MLLVRVCCVGVVFKWLKIEIWRVIVVRMEIFDKVGFSDGILNMLFVFKVLKFNLIRVVSNVYGVIIFSWKWLCLCVLILL